MTTCTTAGCNRKHLARGMCSTHYNTWHRAQRQHEIVCAGCGVRATVDRKAARYCSHPCANRANNKLAVAKVLSQRAPTERHCHGCLQPMVDGRRLKYCSAPCRHRAARGQLRAAYEDGDSAGYLAAVRERSTVDAQSGCWTWNLSMDKGYPIHNLGDRQVYVHRTVLEAKHGQPLGTQAAHHACANTCCVNPDHLQPVTHRENAAEMLARQSYLARIAELESALAELAPNHQLLAQIRVA